MAMNQQDLGTVSAPADDDAAGRPDQLVVRRRWSSGFGGVLVLVVVYWIATLLRLTLTTLLLQALFAVALFALIVVFQPELRRALGQLGQLGPLNRMLIPGGEEEIEGTVDELVRAALLISEAKHGAFCTNSVQFMARAILVTFSILRE